MTTQPNILLLTADQFRADALAALGKPFYHTPNLDALAASGVAFTQATTPCPVCLPARSSLMSGQYPHTHGYYSNHHRGPRPAKNLVTSLSKAGYRTGLSGKNHTFLTADDFDYFDENPPARDAQAVAEREAWFTEDPWRKHRPVSSEAAPGGLAADPDHACTDAALDFMRADDARPFFLWLSWLAPHSPYQVPEPFFSQFANADIPPPAVESGGLAAAGKPLRQQLHAQNVAHYTPFSNNDIATMRRVYAAMVALIDHEAGRVLDFLEANGMRENTLVVFTSDHGDYQGDHGLTTKSPALYDCLTRVPLLVSQPQTITPATCNAPASLVDLMPTLLDWANITESPACDCGEGRSLTPFLRGEPMPSDWPTATFAEYGLPGTDVYTPERLAAESLADAPQENPFVSGLPWEGNPVALSGPLRMIRTADWKLIREPGGTSELYDLKNDPNELTNLYSEPTCDTIRTYLKGLMRNGNSYL